MPRRAEKGANPGPYSTTAGWPPTYARGFIVDVGPPAAERPGMSQSFWIIALVLATWVCAGNAAAEAGRRVLVTEFKVVGNTLLSRTAVDTLLSRFTGERTVDELKAAAAALQEAYRTAGYGSVVAYLPEQPLTGGPLTLTVLEGRIATVEVVGNTRFSSTGIRASVPQLQEGRTPHVQRIDTQLRLANENPARKLALTLQAGANTGDVDARITVTEEPVSRFSAVLDNTGNEQTGRTRLGLAYQNAQPFGLDHQLAVQTQLAPEKIEALRVFSASYRVPLYAAGWMAGVYGTYSNVDAGRTPTAAGAVQFNGRGRVLGASMARLLARAGELERRVSLSLDARQYLNNCAIEGLPAGACGAAGESVSVMPLTLEYAVQRGGERAVAASLSLSRNLGLGGRHGNAAAFEAVRPGADKSYTLLRAAGDASWLLPQRWQIGLRASAQFSADALVPGEQLGLAGASLVRGYEEREVTGDIGLLGTLELTSPPLAGQPLIGVAFVDAGTASNRLGTACVGTATRCSLAAAGLGLRYGHGPVQIKLDVAAALRDGRSTERGDTRLHVQAGVAFP
jgi:hemolysin activation/secretion protein